MWKTSLGLALASALMLVGSASADSFTFTNAGNVTWNGVYVNPYQAVNNTHPANNPLTIYCDDWNTDFSGYPTWDATVYTLTANNVLDFKYGATKLNYNVVLDSVHNALSVVSSGTPDPFNRYLEAAWLDEQWRDVIGTGAASTDKQIKLAAAMWTLFVDGNHVGNLIGAINGSGYASDVYHDLQDAQTAVAHGYDAAGWDVIVTSASNSFPMQEFLVYTPEPSAMILLGSVMAYLGFAKFRKKRPA